MRLNRRVPNGTHGGVRGRGSFSPSYSIACFALSAYDYLVCAPIAFNSFFRLYIS